MSTDMLLRGVLGAVLCAALAFGATHHNPYCEITEEHTLCQYEVSTAHWCNNILIYRFFIMVCYGLLLFLLHLNLETHFFVIFWEFHSTGLRQQHPNAQKAFDEFLPTVCLQWC